MRLLASRVTHDELVAKLERALANNNSIVGLTVPERERIVAALDDQTLPGLVELREELIKQLDKHRAREAKELRIRMQQENLRGQRGDT